MQMYQEKSGDKVADKSRSIFTKTCCLLAVLLKTTTRALVSIHQLFFLCGNFCMFLSPRLLCRNYHNLNRVLCVFTPAFGADLIVPHVSEELNSRSRIYYSPWSRKMEPTPAFLPGNFHGQRSLAGCSPSGHKESDVTGYTQEQPASMHLREGRTVPTRKQHPLAVM